MSFNQQQITAYQNAAALCSRGEKCSSEILDKLKIWGLSEDESAPVIEKLVNEKYIDEERFACAYIKDKFRFNNWGRQKIAYLLRAKNISEEIIQTAFEEIDDSQYSDKLKTILEDKARSVKAKDAFEKRNKLMRFALGRGFESGEIYKALKEMGI